MDPIARIVELALEEDIGSGDITTGPLIAPDLQGRGDMRAKEPLVVAGLQVARQVFRRLDPGIRFTAEVTDGQKIESGRILARVEGSLSTLLTGERTALNFVQRLSGIATLVRDYVEALDGASVRLTDTRKTTPGWRVLEKYAVTVGGGYNHRMGLYDGVLIKDNHITACGGIAAAVDRIRRRTSHLTKIEVETSDMDQVEEALAAGVDVVMLDNMSTDQIRAAVRWIDHRAVVEVSGGIDRKRLPELAATGVDIISVGALTHSARNMDINMKIVAHEGRAGHIP